MLDPRLISHRLAFQSIGAVYGDIGTSPLYVYSSTFTSEPAYDELVSALSLIIWTLIIMVTVKYCFIVLYADDEGEGGTFALYSLLSRYARIAESDPNRPQDIEVKRIHTGDLRPETRGIRRWLEGSSVFKFIISFLAVSGVCMVLADGVLTPAQSVLGAIQGIKIVSPNLSVHSIVGISCAILVLLFVIQPLGIHRLATSYAPIVIIWLLLNAIFGIYNLVKFDHSVLKAFSPLFAGRWFSRYGSAGWHRLGGILLAFTGVEALFADLGAFSRRAIQLSWSFFVLPCLLLAYIGQAAYISVNPSAYSNPLFASVPHGLFWPTLIIAILAATVASQAMITGAFQILIQAIAMDYFPRIQVKHTSTTFHGQVYIPSTNWLLLAGTVLVTAIYNNTTSLGNAYGLCVVFVTIITTNMTALVALVVWRIHPLIVFPIWLPFACFDGLYLSAALFKVPSGAWFTLMLAAILASVMFLWRFGKTRQWAAQRRDRISTKNVVQSGPEGDYCLTPDFGGQRLSNLTGCGIYFDEAGCKTPSVYLHFVRTFEALHSVGIFFHLREVCLPRITESDRYTIRRADVPNTFRITFRHGYADTSIADHFTPERLTGALSSWLERDIAQAGLGSEAHTRATRELTVLDEAVKHRVTYLLGKTNLRPSDRSSFVSKFLLYAYSIVRANASTRATSWNLPGDQMVEIGTVKEI